VPPGTNESNIPTPIFSLMPSATVDEGNNWINMRWGPLSLTNQSNGTNNGTVLGNFTPAQGSTAIDYVPSAANTYAAAPSTDFFGNPRKTGNAPVDAGAIEVLTPQTTFTLTPSSLAFGNQSDRTISASQPVTLQNTGANALSIGTISFTGANPGQFTQTNNCPASVAAGGNCTINVSFAPGTTSAGAKSANLRVTAGNAPTQTVSLSGTALVGTPSFSGPVPALTTVPATTAVKNGTITVTNNATGTNAGPLTLTAAPTASRTPGQPNDGTFSVTGGTCVSGFVLNPNSANSCTIFVRYTPNAGNTGTTQGRVTITDTGATTASQNSSNFSAN
jgi:hypothetical protein